MNESAKFELGDVVELQRLFRLQWEETQDRFVLLYPEGMVQLNQSAGEILKRCNGVNSIALIAAELEKTFNEPDLKQDVLQFMEVANGKGWIRVKPRT